MFSLALWILIAMFLSGSPWPSLVGRWPRYEGFLTLGLYLAIFLVGAKVLGGSRSLPQWKALRLSLAAVSLPLFAISAMESLGLRPLGGGLDDRPGATLGNATDQGLIGFIIAGVLSTPSSSEQGWQLWLRRAGLAASAAVVLLSGSRAALVGLAIVALHAAILWMRSRLWTGLKAGLGAAAAIAGLAVAALMVPTTRERLLSAGTVDGRLLLWERSLALISGHPLSGVGPSGFVDGLPAFLNDDWARSVGDTFPTDSPHNWILQALAAGGVPLLLLALACAGTAMWLFRARLMETQNPELKRYLLVTGVAILAYWIALLTHFTSIGTTALVALLCGGLVGRDRVPVASTPVRPAATSITRFGPLLPRVGGIVLACVCLAVAMPATLAEWSMSSGAQAARSGDPERAEQAFRLSHSLRPWDSDTALLAAQAFAGPATTGDQLSAQHAVEWARLAREVTPHSQEAGLALAIGYIYSGELDEAKALLDELLAEAPSSTSLFVQRGVANFGLGRTAESIDDLQRAATLDPTLEEPWRVLSAIYQRMGDDGAAQAAMERAETLSP
ncbi:O-antigen ligase family protein [Arthrobacter sp. StoSoilB5]|uniref:O-antigen ligase family protein n=1 Tax=Arthrobacter sp. StoSoilB5 TaxID=2830992 RepID=UPI001CC61908|nr:O-antigen ligase family protein [Arthrobacter sp. StoSoilB5]